MTAGGSSLAGDDDDDDMHNEKLGDIQELESGDRHANAHEEYVSVLSHSVGYASRPDSVAYTSHDLDELTHAVGENILSSGSRHGHNHRDGVHSNGDVMHAWGEPVESGTHGGHHHQSIHKTEKFDKIPLGSHGHAHNGSTDEYTHALAVRDGTSEHAYASVYGGDGYSGPGLKSTNDSYNSYGAASKKLYASHTRSVRPSPWDEAFALPLGGVLRESRATSERGVQAYAHHEVGKQMSGQHGSRGVEGRGGYQNGVFGGSGDKGTEVMMMASSSVLGGLGREGDVVVAVSVTGTRSVEGLRPAEDVDLFVCEYIRVGNLSLCVCITWLWL
jgi:hypothetical protein